MPVPSIVPLTDVSEASGHDAWVLVAPKAALGTGSYSFASAIEAHLAADAAAASGPFVVLTESAPGGRVIVSPVASLTREGDDVRRVADATAAGIKRARAAGSCTRIVLFLDGALQPAELPSDYQHALLTALIAAAGACYAPLPVRTAKGEAAAEPVTTISFLWSGAPPSTSLRDVAAVAEAVEVGKRVARDVGASDPEEGTPIRCVEYLTAHVASLPGVSMRVIDEPAAIKAAFPLAHAVARASLAVPRHHPRIVRLEYSPEGADASGAAAGGGGGSGVKQQVFVAGKGVTYDTGGADLKTGGAMAGMSRDKAGAAAAAGFIATLSRLRGTAYDGVRCVAWLGFVRNSTGPDAYVADEIITSAAGVRCCIVNTDAEGRLVLADMLHCIKEEIESQAPAERPPTVVHTLATLTGHAVISVGPGYSITVPNAVAKARGVDAMLARAGAVLGDPFETSHLRREDFDFVAPKTPAYDVKQANTLPSVSTPRGHIFPAAFLLIASGLDAHGRDSADPIPFAHLDVAASTVAAPFLDGIVTGQPVAALTGAYVLGL